MVNISKLLCLFLANCLVVQPVLALSPQSTPSTAAGDAQTVARQELSKATVIARFQGQSKESKSIQILDGKLRSLEYFPTTDESRYWGTSTTYQRTVDGKPQHLIYTIYLRDYVKANSKDGAALAQTTLTNSTGETQTYSYYLLAPGGDLAGAQEYAVTNGEVALQHSWWTCVKGQLDTVGGKCTAALVGCAGPALIAGTFSWATYLACVAGACASACVIAGLCCSCNGSSWCDWAVGKCSEGASTSPKAGPPCEVYDPYTKKNVPCPTEHAGRCCGVVTVNKQTMEQMCTGGEWIKSTMQCP